jgi:hypothetical protein
MTHFNEGLSLLIVCQRSLAVFEDAVHEQQVIREAIAKFMAVYEEIDAADQALKDAGMVLGESRMRLSFCLARANQNTHKLLFILDNRHYLEVKHAILRPWR